MKPMTPARTERRLRRFAMGYLAGMNELRRRLITDAAIVQTRHNFQWFEDCRNGAFTPFLLALIEGELFASRTLDRLLPK